MRRQFRIYLAVEKPQIRKKPDLNFVMAIRQLQHRWNYDSTAFDRRSYERLEVLGMKMKTKSMLLPGTS